MTTSARVAKRMLARALDSSGLLQADFAARGAATVIAVNYHGTPARWASLLGHHFAFYSERFECLSEDELLCFLRGELRLHRPGIVISFDDGLRNNAAVAAPLLEKFSLRGWFMVPGAFLDEPEASQPGYFKEHIRPVPNAEHPADEAAFAMTWDAARGLAERGHVIGCHTWSHRPLGPGTSTATVEREVGGAKQELEEKLGRGVRTFCWARGQVGDYSAPAHRAVARTYELAFSSLSRAIHVGADPLALHRFNVEASFPLSLVRFQISRFNELSFAGRRRAVDAMLRGSAS